MCSRAGKFQLVIVGNFLRHQADALVKREVLQKEQLM